MKNSVQVLLFLILFFSCKKSDIERSLTLAGDNAVELRKVLDHYSKNIDDSLKYKAAVFLMENMPGHYSFGGKSVDNFYRAVDSVLLVEKNKEVLKQKIDSIAKMNNLPKSAERFEDIKCVTAEFLINNIERAFEVWPSGGYAHHLNFDQFCEYILPYRVRNEPIEFWRDSLAAMYNDIRLHGYNEGWRYSAFHACCELNNRLREETGVYLLPVSTFPIEKYSVLRNMSIGTCSDYCARAIFAMRAKGIPVVEDFTPQWPYRALGHTWNVVFSSNGKEYSFGGVDTNPDVIHKPDSKLSKVYRRTYALNKNSLAALCHNEPIPSNLNNLFMRDVTDNYTKTFDVKVETLVSPLQKRKFVYLCVFDNRRWVPVAHAGNKRGGITFENMGYDVMYLPGYFINEGIRPANYPFLLDFKGRIHYYKPDTLDTYNLRFKRKYPSTFRVIGVTRHMIGGEIQAADNPEFDNPQIIHRIEKNPNGFYVTISLDTLSQCYKYWRHVSPVAGYGNIAELQFFGSNGELLNNKGKIIGTDKTWGNDPKRSRESAFDGDPLTFFDSSLPDSAWVGLEFPEPVSVKKIVYLPRNDGNNVTIGDEYELFYCSLYGWRSLGRKIAKDYFVEFANVPKNAVLWLHNHTRGNEERIFTFDGRHTFWW